MKKIVLIMIACMVVVAVGIFGIFNSVNKENVEASMEKPLTLNEQIRMTEERYFGIKTPASPTLPGTETTAMATITLIGIGGTFYCFYQIKKPPVVIKVLNQKTG